MMPDHSRDPSLVHGEGRDRVRAPEPMAGTDAPVDDGAGIGGSGVDEFLAALDLIWDVPVGSTGMAVAFDAQRHA